MPRGLPIWIKLRTTIEERALWQAKADASDQSLSSLIRGLLNETKVRQRKRVQVDPDLLRQLALIGNNLNQLARWANRDREAVEAQAVIARLIEIDRELAALRETSARDGAAVSHAD